jgi:superfamily II DNA/RNA helicase
MHGHCIRGYSRSSVLRILTGISLRYHVTLALTLVRSFKSTPSSILLATDVAARGLDVSAVDHVIHYQVPRSADAYVHRNGRTARAMKTGFGLVLCAPDERRVFKGVLTGLGRGMYVFVG